MDRQPTFFFSSRPSGVAKGLKIVTSLLDKSEAFRRSMANSEIVIRNRLGWSLINVIESIILSSSDPGEDRIEPMMTSIQIALCDLLESCDVTPSSVLCLSGGEFAAAYACRALNSSDALSLSCEWAQSITDCMGTGASVCVSVSANVAMDIASHADFPVYLACDIAKTMSVLSLSNDNIESLINMFSRRGIKHKIMPFRAGYHSPLMRQWQFYMEQIIHLLDINNPAIPIYSAAAGGRLANLNSQHWFNVIAEPAYFQAATLTSMREGCSLFLEINVAQNLKTVIEEIAIESMHDAEVLYLLDSKDGLKKFLGSFEIFTSS